MSRKAKMRPATTPSGSRMTASVTESQTSSRPRIDRDEPVAGRRAVGRLEAALEHVDRRAAERGLGGDARDPLRRRVPEHDASLAVDGDDAVGDVGEDRDRPLPLERDALVQLGVRERRRRARGDGLQRLDLLLPPLARLLGVDGEDAGDGAFGRGDGDAEEGGVPGGEHRVERAEPLLGAGVRERDRHARLHDVAREPAARRSFATRALPRRRSLPRR